MSDMQLSFKDRGSWRKWLKKNHDAHKEVWLVFYKKHTGKPSISYEEAVREALCFGWIDSTVKRLDDERYAQKFTPRRAGSNWSPTNRLRYEELKSKGLLAPPGLKRAPTGESKDPPMQPALKLPRYIEKRLKTVPVAWKNFKALAPSYRRAYIGWIDSAKREETREKRLREALELLATGKKLGMK
jgi:uncharacterized protein YdeI (YjbR/CyaY-like superfamily)